MKANSIHLAKYNQSLISNVFICSPTGVITIEHRISQYITDWRNNKNNNN
jgi:hypothetical protein